MAPRIDAAAVLGVGTMVSGIAGLCAEAGCRALLGMTRDAADQARARMTTGRAPVLDDPASAGRIATAASLPISPGSPVTTGAARR